MKIMIFALLLAATGANAQFHTESAFTFEGGAIGEIDCEPYETFSEWSVLYRGDTMVNCFQTKDALYTGHSWVYATHNDVNINTNTTLAMYCTCGCSKSENQARICERCLRHERRVRSYGAKPKEKIESKYRQLERRIKNPVVRIGDGTGDGEIRFHEIKGGFIVGVATGKKPKPSGVVFSITSDAETMYISGADGIEGETFRENASKFYTIKTSDGFAVKSIGALPEFSVYAIKVTF